VERSKGQVDASLDLVAEDLQVEKHLYAANHSIQITIAKVVLKLCDNSVVKQLLDICQQAQLVRNFRDISLEPVLGFFGEHAELL